MVENRPRRRSGEPIFIAFRGLKAQVYQLRKSSSVVSHLFKSLECDRDCEQFPLMSHPVATGRYFSARVGLTLTGTAPPFFRHRAP
jgi:hypothetical protein